LSIGGEAAFHAYLRQARMMNRIRDELRPRREPSGLVRLEESRPDDGTSPLEAGDSAEAVGRYDRLQRLTEEERE